MTIATPMAAHPLTAGSTSARIVRIIGLLGIIGGAVMLIVGGLVWGTVSSQLASEKITVASDASFLAGTTVDNPLSALAQANIINHHAMEASGGLTYAELAQDSKVRPTVMTASLLRASLFTSIVAFGVSFFAMDLGVLVGLFGWAIFVLTPHTSKKATSPAVA